MPDLVRAAGGVFVAALASAGMVVTLTIIAPQLLKSLGYGLSGAVELFVFALMIWLSIAAFMFLFAFVPAVAFRIMAEARGWRHPVLYVAAGSFLGFCLTLTTSLLSSPESGERMLGYIVSGSGIIGGWVFSRKVVHPLRRAAVSTKSAP